MSAPDHPASDRAEALPADGRAGSAADDAGLRRTGILKHLTSGTATAVVLALFYAVLLLSVRQKSATIDEPGHATAGYTYWKFGDYRLDPENGILPKRIIGLPLALGDFRFPGPEAAAWKQGNINALSNQWLYDLGNDLDAILTRGRAAIAVLAVGLGVVVWLWSRQLFGPVGGMLSLLLYVTNPGVLANGALMTSDLTSAFFLLLSLWAFCAMLRAPTLRSIAGSAIAMGLLFVAKMSAIIIIPVAVVLAAAWLIAPGHGEAGDSGSQRRRRMRWILVAGIAHAVGIVLLIWACYGFRFRASPDSEPNAVQANWARRLVEAPNAFSQLKLSPLQQAQAAEILRRHEAGAHNAAGPSAAALGEVRRTVLTPEQGAEFDRLTMQAWERPLLVRVAAFALRHKLLPEAYVAGYTQVWRSNRERVAFLNGELKVNEGWVAFFPFVVLVKSPLAWFGVLGLAAAAGWRGWRGGALAGSKRFEIVALLLLAGAYLAAAMLSSINIGHRHILPIYPPLFVFCGIVATCLHGQTWLAAASAARRRVAVAITALLGVAMIETACWFPNYLSYFNGLVRPSRAHRHLIDSSLDWGQDLPALRTYIDEKRPAQPLYLAQFGQGVRPDHYRVPATTIYNGIPHPLIVLQGVTWENHRPAIEDFFREHPEYDGRGLAKLQDGTSVSSVALSKAELLRLTGGTYFISATCMQPTYPRALGPWVQTYEDEYQRLKKAVANLLSDDIVVRLTALKEATTSEWLERYEQYAALRFARLTAFLRRREPDDTINYSILVFRLSDAEVSRALDGPAPATR